MRPRMPSIVALSFLMGIALILVCENLLPMLEAWIVRDPAKQIFRALVVLGVFCALLVSPPAGFGVYLWSFGRTVVRTKRFPPPGVAVIRDTPILQNQDAYRRGRLLQILAVLLFVASCCLLTLMVLVANSIAAGQNPA